MSNSRICLICQEEISNGFILKNFCNHSFHQSCLQEIYEKTAQKGCPICGKKLKDPKLQFVEMNVEEPRLFALFSEGLSSTSQWFHDSLFDPPKTQSNETEKAILLECKNRKKAYFCMLCSKLIQKGFVLKPFCEHYIHQECHQLHYYQKEDRRCPTCQKEILLMKLDFYEQKEFEWNPMAFYAEGVAGKCHWM